MPTHAIDFATLAAIGLIILVAAAFSFLAWRMLSKPPPFEQTRRHVRMIQAFDEIPVYEELSPQPFVDAVATPEPAIYKHRPHPDCRACDWPASRCGNPMCPQLPKREVPSSTDWKAPPYVRCVCKACRVQKNFVQNEASGLCVWCGKPWSIMETIDDGGTPPRAA